MLHIKHFSLNIGICFENLRLLISIIVNITNLTEFFPTIMAYH